MTDMPAQTQEGAQLAKPAEWALHVVVAALKFIESTDAAVLTYTSPDGGCIDVLNVLNRHEAHGKYEWPVFAGYDFAQAMRIRRALVNDVFVTLEKTGRVEIVSEQAPATPQRSGKKTGDSVDGTKTVRKRKRAGSQDIKASSDDVDFESDKFLGKTMRELFSTLEDPMSTYTDQIDLSDESCEPEVQLAHIFYDAFVQEWDDLDQFIRTPDMRRKAELWDKHKKLMERRASPEL